MIATQTPGIASKRVLIGVALSILVHVAIVFSSRPMPQPYIAPPPAPAPIVVHLQPPPAPAPLVEAASPSPVPAARSRTTAPRRVIAVAPKPSAAAEPAVVVEAQPVETPPPAPKKFDLEAARSTARIVGLQDAPNADDAPLARLKKQEQANQIRSESKAAQAISGAKRGDCKDGVPGGLLAPLIMLTQKAGTGCKW